MPVRPRTVVIGAGFGGLWAARALAGAPVDVLLLDRNNFHVFLPLLYQVAAELEPEDIVYPVRGILRCIGGGEPLPFRYRDPGVMVILGRNAAVAHVGGRSFTGFPAWALWLTVHIYKLIGSRNRLVVLINWAWDYFFYERAQRLILP